MKKQFFRLVLAVFSMILCATTSFAAAAAAAAVIKPATISAATPTTPMFCQDQRDNRTNWEVSLKLTMHLNSIFIKSKDEERKKTERNIARTIISYIAVLPHEIFAERTGYHIFGKHSTKIRDVHRRINESGVNGPRSNILLPIFQDNTRQCGHEVYRLDYCKQKFIGIVAGRPVLDVGAGNGHTAMQALAMGASSVTAVDINPKCIANIDHVFSQYCDDPSLRSKLRGICADIAAPLSPEILAGAPYGIIGFPRTLHFMAPLAGLDALVNLRRVANTDTILFLSADMPERYMYHKYLEALSANAFYPGYIVRDVDSEDKISNIHCLRAKEKIPPGFHFPGPYSPGIKAPAVSFTPEGTKALGASGISHQAFHYIDKGTITWMLDYTGWEPLEIKCVAKVQGDETSFVYEHFPVHMLDIDNSVVNLVVTARLKRAAQPVPYFSLR